MPAVERQEREQVEERERQADERQDAQVRAVVDLESASLDPSTIPTGLDTSSRSPPETMPPSAWPVTTVTAQVSWNA